MSFAVFTVTRTRSQSTSFPFLFEEGKYSSIS
jgi:hypothetical protein